MPRSKETFEAMREATRQKIEVAALSLIARKGISVTVDEIAKNAGVSKGLLYNHYPSKEALIGELLSQAVTISGETLRQFAESEGSALSKIKQITSVMCDMFSENNRGIDNFMFMAQVGMSGFLSDKPVYNTPNAPNPLGSLVKIIAIGQHEGFVVSGDPTELAFTYWAAIQGICCYKIMGMSIAANSVMLMRILLKENCL
ncbi:MAG: TetR/AcrR family transcriptional regulator [Oscillospiraceae bacterium]|nr:TetR/AcrR family transcriptional regulator [Oscillospiraceae bacterium]